jgi:hypothetical protein
VWEPAWQDLAEVSSATWTKRPRKLGDWQQLFGTIYPTTAIDSYSNAIGRLVEEMGELAESIRTYAIAPGHFLNEAADVFAWIMKIQNISDRDSYGLGGEYGQDLDNAYLNAYLWRCNDCYSSPCKCPAILPTTIGRISLGPSDKDIIGSIFASPQELMAIFSMTDQEPEEVLDQELLSLLTSGVRQLVLLLEASRSLHGSEVEESRAMFKELERLATDSLNFNAATFELAKAIGSQPEQEKSMIEQFLLSVDSSLFATALVTLVGLHFS